jgi:hypothetical protein
METEPIQAPTQVTNHVETINFKDMEDLNAHQIGYFRQLCERKGLTASGSKYELIGRLCSQYGSALNRESFENVKDGRLHHMCQGAGIESASMKREDMIDSLVGVCHGTNTAKVTFVKPKVSLVDPSYVEPPKISSAPVLPTLKKTPSQKKPTFQSTSAPTTPRGGSLSSFRRQEKVAELAKVFENSQSHVPTLKRERTDSSPVVVPKRRKVETPPSPPIQSPNEIFLEKAPKLKVQIEDETYFLEPEIRSGSRGWRKTGKQLVSVDGKKEQVTWELVVKVQDS